MADGYILKQKAAVKELENLFAKGESKSTVVDMQKDYANSKQITLTSVAFLPENITEGIIKNVIDPLRKIEPNQYFYPAASMHLTIKNIRTIHEPPIFNESDVNKVNKLFNDIISKFQAFEFKVEDVLIFPTSISVMAYSSDVLQKLVSALDKGLKEIGVPDDKKYLFYSVFWGNITVCRFTEKPSDFFIAEVKKIRNLKIGKFKVEKINLVTGNVVFNENSKRIVAEYKLKQSHAI
jgi:2'-5' RNA ligase